jgi:hypothetical protein
MEASATLDPLEEILERPNKVGDPAHMKTETDPASETLCSLVF